VRDDLDRVSRSGSQGDGRAFRCWSKTQASVRVVRVEQDRAEGMARVMRINVESIFLTRVHALQACLLPHLRAGQPAVDRLIFIAGSFSSSSGLRGYNTSKAAVACGQVGGRWECPRQKIDVARNSVPPAFVRHRIVAARSTTLWEKRSDTQTDAWHSDAPPGRARR